MQQADLIAVYVSLGSNLGDSENTLAAAHEYLAHLPQVAAIVASSLYLTEPQDFKEQGWFYNQVLRLDCLPKTTAYQLLEQLQEIETKLGRVRDTKRRFGPRVIDLDLLLFGNVCSVDPKLVLPHPRLENRAFVLIPLQEISPGFILPCGSSLEYALSKLTFRLDGIKIYQ